MYIKCLCGNTPNNVASPNNVEHLLLNSYAIEKLQDLVDEEVKENGSVDMWPEHWDKCGAIEVWKCLECGRLLFNPKGAPKDVMVYKFERKGLDT
jgi:hypothetical protein